MTWAKVDDKLFSHPKWIATSTPGKALWVSALSWCASQENDGHVPAHVLPLLGATKAAARSLVASGLWEETGVGYVFHDWIEYQPDGATVKAVRAQKSSGGKEGNHRRWHVARRTKVEGCEFCESDNRSESDRVTESEPNPPDPAPARTRIPTTGSRPASPPVTREDEPPPDPYEPEMSVNALLASAGLAQAEHRDFLVALKGNGARNTTALVNALYRDGKLAGRIGEWRTERDLATEAAAKPAKSSRVSAHADLVQQFAAQEAAENVFPFRQITEGA